MARVTRLGLYGGARSRYAFQDSGAKSFTGAFTRLGVSGFARQPYGSFEGKVGAVVSITDVNVTESWTDGASGLVITGSGFV